jgi:hypothetical protein
MLTCPALSMNAAAMTTPVVPNKPAKVSTSD